MTQKTRSYKLSISVTVDDATKPEYDVEMEKLCNKLLHELKAIARAYDRGTGRLVIATERI
jgi:hypothetical protein